MLQRNGEDIASKSVFNEANLKEHLRGKTADELIEELEKLYDEEELTGEEFDPRIVEIYIEAMEKVSPPDPAAERAFDRSWALFHTKHRVEKEPSSSHRAVKIRWRIEAAVLIVIFLCVSAAAFGWKDYIITWKDELFGTVPHIPGTMELKEPNVSGYRSLKEAVQKYTDISVVPGWIPPGYTIDEIYEMEVESADVISATYRDGQKSIVIRVFCYRNTEDISDLWVEKDSGLYKDTYQTHGIEHAISENYGHTQIMWRNGQCTCSITGDISRADAERMIKSIYENGG